MSKSIPCRKPVKSGIRTRLQPKGETLPWYSTARRSRSCATGCSTRDRSLCSMARARLSSAKCRSRSSEATETARSHERSCNAPDARTTPGKPALAAFQAHRADIFERAATLRLPAVCQWVENAEEGGLVAYGPRVQKLYRQLAACQSIVPHQARRSPSRTTNRV